MGYLPALDNVCDSDIDLAEEFGPHLVLIFGSTLFFLFGLGFLFFFLLFLLGLCLRLWLFFGWLSGFWMWG